MVFKAFPKLFFDFLACLFNPERDKTAFPIAEANLLKPLIIADFAIFKSAKAAFLATFAKVFKTETVTLSSTVPMICNPFINP